MINHYSILSKLYNFFKILVVKRAYTGTKLKRLITTRWSGHFDSVVAFRCNVAELIEALETCLRKKDINSDHISTAIGLLKFIKSSQFIVTNEFVYEILQLLNIALKVLQGRGATFAAVNKVIENCKRLLQEKRNTWGEERISREIETARTLHNIRERLSLTRNALEHVEDFVVTESLPQLTTKDPKSMCVSSIEVMDHFISEFDRRFSQYNIDVWMAVDYLVPEKKDFLCPTKFKPLLDYVMSIPDVTNNINTQNAASFKAECDVFRCPLNDVKWKRGAQEEIELRDVSTYVTRQYSCAAPCLSNLYKIALTFGFTSATVEFIVYRRTIIDSARRQSIMPYCESNLTLLYFEKQLCRDVTFEEFRAVWRKKSRRITL